MITCVPCLIEIDEGNQIMSSPTTHIITLTRFNDILNKISEIVETARKNHSARQLLRSILKDLTLVVQDIKQYNDHLDHPREEINSLIEENDAAESACKASSENDFYVVDENQSLIVNDVEQTLYKAREILELLNHENLEHKFNEAGPPFKRPFDVPENPKFTVGLDIPFSKLKMELLRGGSSTLVLTGLGGLGKTTLATMLCWDEQVKGKS